MAREIVRRQEGFFLHGVSRLRPLTLRAVADEVGLHESTVSRATSGKYLACPRGTFELKYFFTSGVAAADGESASAEAVKAEIARLIAGEGDDILSDDKLMELLNAKGFGLARRTVAKYREAIGLGSSVQRRRRRALEWPTSPSRLQAGAGLLCSARIANGASRPLAPHPAPSEPE